jgi:hypothetical protein
VNAATVPGSPPPPSRKCTASSNAMPSASASMAATRSTSSWPPGAPPVPACGSYRFTKIHFKDPHRLRYQHLLAKGDPAAPERAPPDWRYTGNRLARHAEAGVDPPASYFRLSASPATLLRLERPYKDRGLKPSQVLNESPSRVIRRQAMIQPLVHSESKPLWPFYSHVERQRSRVC